MSICQEEDVHLGWAKFAGHRIPIGSARYAVKTKGETYQDFACELRGVAKWRCLPGKFDSHMQPIAEGFAMLCDVRPIADCFEYELRPLTHASLQLLTDLPGREATWPEIEAKIIALHVLRQKAESERRTNAWHRQWPAPPPPPPPKPWRPKVPIAIMASSLANRITELAATLDEGDCLYCFEEGDEAAVREIHEALQQRGLRLRKPYRSETTHLYVDGRHIEREVGKVFFVMSPERE